MIVLRVAGKATTKQRQRFDPRTKRAYTPPSNIIGENDVRSVWREAGEPRIEDAKAIGIELRIVVMRPQSHFNMKGQLNKQGLSMPFPSNKKPDIDNALKLVMDALNTRAYKDDVQVCKSVVERVWGEWPETIIKIYKLSTLKVHINNNEPSQTTGQPSGVGAASVQRTMRQMEAADRLRA